MVPVTEQVPQLLRDKQFELVSLRFQCLTRHLTKVLAHEINSEVTTALESSGD